MNNKTFAIFLDNHLLVVIDNVTNAPSPLPSKILDWYSREYGFDRKRLSWSCVNKIDCTGMKYEDFN